MYHFIVNIHGGSGKAFKHWLKIRDILKENGIEFETYVPLRPGHATELAKKIAELDEEEIKLVVVGGDGTVNEVLNGIPEDKFPKIKFGLIPTGSGNDFARGLGLPRKNYKKALNLILNSKVGKKIDLGRTSSGGKSKIFGISSGFGLDAIVGTGINTSKIKIVLNKLHMGELSYAVLTVYTLFSMKTMTAKITFDGQDTVEFNKMIFLAAMNSYVEGGGVPMNPDAKMDDGKLSVCVAAGIPKILTFFAFPLLCMGLHKKLFGFSLRNFTSMEVETDSPTISHTDGELFGNLSKVRYDVLPQKLEILI